MDLQRGQSTTDAIQLRQLREKLPKAAQEMIRGIGPANGGIRAAFDRLEKEYGDRDLNILTVQKQLDAFQPKSRDGPSKVEELCHEVERASNLLRGMGAERELERERGLIGRLINKLPFTYQNLWDEHFTSPSTEQCGSEWQVFQNWLLRQRGIALNAKKRGMQLNMTTETKQPSFGNSSSSSKECSKCGQPGHFARFCRVKTTAVSKIEEVLHLKAKEMTKMKEYDEALPEL